MNSIDITIIQSLSHPVAYPLMDESVPVEWFESLTNQLIEILNERAGTDWRCKVGDAKWTAYEIYNVEDVPKSIRKNVKFSDKYNLIKKNIIRIDIEAVVNDDVEIYGYSAVGNEKNELTANDVELHAPSIILHEATDYLSSILNAALFAKPGAFSAAAPIIASQGVHETHNWFDDSVMGIEPMCVKLAMQHRWPPLNNMDLAKAFSWAIELDGFRDAYAVGLFGRALGALRYLAAPGHGNATRIFWAVLGLEALYGHGRGEGLKEQLLSKSELFLGSRKEHKKAFGKIYDYRSSFVHGGRDFPFFNCSKEASAQYEKYMEDDFKMTSLAIAVLISTLQKVAKQNRKSLEFGYSLIDNE